MAYKGMKSSLKLILVLVLLIAACGKKEEKGSLADIIKRHHINASSIEIHIDKSDYELSIFSQGKVLKKYPVVLGTNPVDDKRCEGDRCTPEGKFGVRDKYAHKKWNKFIWIDYPTAESWTKHNATKRAGKISADATIGGEVGIHGVPDSCDFWIDEKNNWTWGCISLKNADLDDFYPFVTSKTSIFISP